jgi:hypothetical protein
MLKLPYRTHVALLPAVSGINLASVQIKCRMLRFACQCIASSNHVVSCLARHCISSNAHIMGSNISDIMREVGGSVHDLNLITIPNTLSKYNSFLTKSQYSNQALHNAGFILDISDNDCDGFFLTESEYADLLNYLCCE